MVTKTWVRHWWQRHGLGIGLKDGLSLAEPDNSYWWCCLCKLTAKEIKTHSPIWLHSLRKPANHLLTHVVHSIPSHLSVISVRTDNGYHLLLLCLELLYRMPDSYPLVSQATAFFTWSEAEPRIQCPGLQLLCHIEVAFLTQHWGSLLRVKLKCHVVYSLKTLYMALVLEREAVRGPRSGRRCGPLYCNSQRYTVDHVSCRTALEPTELRSWHSNVSLLTGNTTKFLEKSKVTAAPGTLWVSCGQIWANRKESHSTSMPNRLTETRARRQLLHNEAGRNTGEHRWECRGLVAHVLPSWHFRL